MTKTAAEKGSLGRRFQLYWVASSISWTGNAITAVALPLFALKQLELTEFEFGIVSASQYLPLIGLSLVFGVLADRFPLRRSLILGLALAGIIMLAIVALSAEGSINFWVFVGLIFLFGCATLFSDIADMSMLPEIVHSRHLARANGRLSSTQSSVELVGPVLSGLIVAWIGARASLVLDSSTFLVAAFLIVILRVNPRERKIGSRNLGKEIRQGLVFTFSDPSLGRLAVISAGNNFLEKALLTTFLVWLVARLEQSPIVVGTMLAIMALGGVFGAGFSTRITQRVGYHRTITIGAAGATASIAAVAVTAVVTSSALATAPMLGLYGLAVGIYNVPAITARQVVSPPNMLGRVTASYRMVSHGAIPVGAITAGILMTWLGVDGTYLTITALCICMLAFIAIRWVPAPSLDVSINKNEEERHASDMV